MLNLLYSHAQKGLKKTWLRGYPAGAFGRMNMSGVDFSAGASGRMNQQWVKQDGSQKKKGIKINRALQAFHP